MKNSHSSEPFSVSSKYKLIRAIYGVLKIIQSLKVKLSYKCMCVYIKKLETPCITLEYAFAIDSGFTLVYMGRLTQQLLIE